MTLQELGNLGEFVGSIAVLVTLIYLARQLHERTQSARTESLNMALGSHVHQIAQVTATDESAELFRRFCEDFSSIATFAVLQVRFWPKAAPNFGQFLVI